MSTFKLQNFKYGLDSRRSELTSVPGTLEVLQNAHVNQGAELEKRKAFISLGIISNDCFGLEVILTGLVTFGSDVPGGQTLPAGLSYIQCAHPSDSTKSMTAILCSCNFGGQAFCIAQFGSEVYWYANGTVIPASIAGQVLTSAGVGTVQTLAQIVAQMYNILSGANFAAAGIFVENLNGKSFSIYTSYGITWSPVIALELTATSTGNIVTTLLSTSTEPIVGASGAAQLTLYAGNAGSLKTLTDVTSKNTYNLIPAPVPYITSLATMMTNLANALVATTNPVGVSLGLAASTSLNTISITTTSTIPSNYLSYTLAAGSNLCFENMSLDFSGVTNGTIIQNIYLTNGINTAAGLTYSALNGTIWATQSGVETGQKAFALPYGTYLWIPGANEKSVEHLAIIYSKVGVSERRCN